MKPFVFNEKNAFCISLESNPTRWDRMQSRFSQFDLKVTKWIASTRDTIIDNFPDYLNDGQKGCSQSHINIWRHIVENDLEYALILEDDACFDKKWIEKLSLFTETNQDMDWHMILLNASEPIEITDQWVCTINKEQYLTGGYIISNKGAKIILNDFKNCFFSADWMTSRDQLYGHSYCYYPWLIIQEGKDSNIGENLEADHAKVLRCLGEINYSIENYII